MSITELSIIVGFILTIAAVGVSYGALSNQVTNIVKRLDRYDIEQDVRDKDSLDWQRGEAGRIKVIRHDILDKCQEQFADINRKLGVIEGQLAELNRVFGIKSKP